MILKPFDVHSPDGKTFYEGNAPQDGAELARKPIIESPDILDRTKGAKERLRDGHALMRVPVHPTDPDCVLADAEIEIERLRAALASNKAAAVAVEEPEPRTYTTTPGESVMGIALRQCGNEAEWRHILACNPQFADMLPHEYFPVGTVLTLPRPPAPIASAEEAVAWLCMPRFADGFPQLEFDTAHLSDENWIKTPLYTATTKDKP